MNVMSKIPVWCLTLILVAFATATSNAQDEEKNPEELMEAARQATADLDFEKAVELLRELDELRPNEPFVHFNLGYNLHASGKLDEAIEYHKKATESDQFKPTALYNLACAYSIKEEKDKAFDYLKQSIQEGFREMNQLKSDPDFKNIKSDPRFQEMVVLLENDGKEPAKKMNAKDLYGNWKIESGSRAGSKIDSSRLPSIKITKESLTIPSPSGEFVMTYKWDLDAKPITVDFKIKSGPAPEGGMAKGIIKMHDDGKMSLCYEPTGEARPEKFLSTEENGFFVFKMEKTEDKTEVKGQHSEMAKAVVGKWKCVKGMRAGSKVSDEAMASTITIEENMITIPVGPDAAFKMSYSIDANSSPMTIDMKIKESPDQSTDEAVGIIKMEDGKFYLCYNPNGTDRPNKFESTESGGEFMFVMERIKE